MIPLGLSVSEQAAFHAALVDSHSIHVTVQILDMAGVVQSDISSRLLDGQVTIDGGADVTRSCTLSLLDPDRTMHFDSDSPDDGALYLDRMIRVYYSIKVTALGRWVSVPVFTGPLLKVDRTDDVINVEAQGKEVLLKGAAWRTYTFKRGTNQVAVIRAILQTWGGEKSFSFPESTARLAADRSIGKQAVPWDHAQAVARSNGWQLFYDGRGTARLRAAPRTSLFTFRTGTGGSVVTAPQITYSLQDVRNIVWVAGGRPRGAKAHVTATAVAPASHPLSPARLGRPGAPRYLLDMVEDASIVKPSVARAIAQTRLRQLLLSSVDVAFDSLVIPHLDPDDLCRLHTDEFNTVFRSRQMSIPLTAGGHMSVGYTKRVSINKARIRR